MDPLTQAELIEAILELVDGGGVYLASFGAGVAFSVGIGIWRLTASTFKEVDE